MKLKKFVVGVVMEEREGERTDQKLRVRTVDAVSAQEALGMVLVHFNTSTEKLAMFESRAIDADETDLGITVDRVGDKKKKPTKK